MAGFFGSGRSSTEESTTGTGDLPVSRGGVNGPVKVAERLRGTTEGTDNLAGAVGVGSSSSTESIGADIIEITGGRLGALAKAVVGRDSVEVPGRANC